MSKKSSRSGKRLDPYRNYPKAVVRRPRVVYKPKYYTPTLTLLRPSKPYQTFQTLPLIEIEDRREFSPTKPYGARMVTGRSDYNLTPFGPTSLPHQIGFESPKKTLICIRRKQRREVLLAKGKGGKARRAKRNQYSDIRC